MSDLLFQRITSLGSLTNSEALAVVDSFSTISIGKNGVILKEGQVCKTVGLIETGLMMYYKISVEGDEIACDFAKENDWVCQYESFISKTPSPLFIKAIEPSIMHTISFERLQGLYEAIPGLDRLVRQFFEQAFVGIVNRSLAFQSLDAEGRYRRLLTDYPSIVQRVPQYYVASFLNIAPPSLSRIRKNISG